jgi:hypothetical protein
MKNCDEAHVYDRAPMQRDGSPRRSDGLNVPKLTRRLFFAVSLLTLAFSARP